MYETSQGHSYERTKRRRLIKHIDQNTQDEDRSIKASLVEPQSQHITQESLDVLTEIKLITDSAIQDELQSTQRNDKDRNLTSSVAVGSFEHDLPFDQFSLPFDDFTSIAFLNKENKGFSEGQLVSAISSPCPSRSPQGSRVISELGPSESSEDLSEEEWEEVPHPSHETSFAVHCEETFAPPKKQKESKKPLQPETHRPRVSTRIKRVRMPSMDSRAFSFQPKKKAKATSKVAVEEVSSSIIREVNSHVLVGYRIYRGLDGEP